MALERLKRYSYSVYAIQHNKTKRIYVSVSRNIQERIRAHMYLLKQGKHSNEVMQRDYIEHGEDYSFYELESNIDYENRMSAEAKWISKLDVINNGYNRVVRKKQDYNIVKGVPGLEYLFANFDDSPSESKAV